MIKIINVSLIVLITLLSIAAGLAKVMQEPAEMAFLISLNLSHTMILLFGFIQLLGGLLTAITKSRHYGAGLVFIGFFISNILVIISGNLSFALISLIPVVLTAVVFYQTIHPSANLKPNKL